MLDLIWDYVQGFVYCLIYILTTINFDLRKTANSDNNYALTSSAIRDIIIKLKPDFTPGTLEMSK